MIEEPHTISSALAMLKAARTPVENYQALAVAAQMLDTKAGNAATPAFIELLLLILVRNRALTESLERVIKKLLGPPSSG